MKKTFYASKGSKGQGTIKCVMLSSKGTRYTAAATCSDNDEFSLIKGMEIAEKRATLKQLRRIEENLTKRAHAEQIKVNRIERKADKVSERIWQLEDELDILCTDPDED